MISTDSRMTDKEDVAVLFLAMCKFGEENDDLEMWADSFGELLSRAELAAEVIAEHHVVERWDAVMWFEYLESTDEDSLAARLFMLDSLAADAVSQTTMQWLKDI